MIDAYLHKSGKAMLTFRADKEITGTLQRLPGVSFSKRDGAWLVPIRLIPWVLEPEFPEIYISKGLQEEYQKVKIEYDAMQEIRNGEVSLDIDFPFPIPPYAAQKIGIALLLLNKRYALFDQQGGGKSMSSLVAAWSCLKHGECERVLIISQAFAKIAWDEEIKKWLPEGTEYEILGPGEMANPRRYKIHVINYDNIYSKRADPKKDPMSKQWIRELAKRQIVIMDAAHRLKNHKAKRSIAAREIAEGAARVWFLTGTPVPGGADSVWHCLHILDPEIAGSKTDFTRKFSWLDGEYFSVKGSKNMEVLNRAMQTVSIRRTMEEFVDLPGKVRQDVEVELTQEQAKIYVEMADMMRATLTRMDQRDIIVKAKSVLSQLLRLIQIAGHPGLIGPWEAKTTGKLTYLEDTIEEIIGSEKVIIWTNFIAMNDLLMERFKRHNPVQIYGGTSYEDRKRAVDEFRNNDQRRIMVANAGAGGEGITLISASRAIYHDRTFSFPDFEESQRRIYRPGQDKRVIIQVLRARLPNGLPTIDHYIDQILLRKEQESESIVGDADVLNRGNLINMLRTS